MNKGEKKRDQREDRIGRLAQELRKHPELVERFEAIVELTRAQEELPGGGDGMNVNDVEDRLVEEVRKLGKQTMEEWAKQAKVRAEEGFQKESIAAAGGKARVRKKRS